MSEVIIHQPPSLDLDTQMKYSSALSASSIIPPDYRNSPANVLVAIGYAQALGEHPIVALTDVYIVKGRPSMSAAMMHRRAIEAGHRVRVTASPTEATASIWRKDDPEFEHRVTWTIDRAKASGLAGTDTWKKFPSAMLRSRAISEACRLACPEVLGAVKHTPDELGGAFVDADEVTVDAAPVATTKVSRRKPTPAPSQDAEEVREEVAASTRGQDDLRAAITATVDNKPSEAAFKRMFAILNEHGLGGRDESLGYVSSIIGRDIASRNELTATEVAKVSDSFNPTPTNEETN